MYINEIFELTRAVNSDEFDRLIARVRDNLEEEEGEEYADRSLSHKEPCGRAGENKGQ